MEQIVRDLFLGRAPTVEEVCVTCNAALTVDCTALTVDYTALQSEILRNTV